jgi:hypothetical protein
MYFEDDPCAEEGWELGERIGVGRVTLVREEEWWI